MEEKEKIMLAQKWVRQLANGINPLNGDALKEDDIVNNVHVSRCLFYVADMLDKLSDRKVRPLSARKAPFNPSVVQIEKYNSEDIVSISTFAREIAKLIPENMQNISYKSMTTWLIQRGLLKDSEPNDEGKIYKIATESGERLGIKTQERLSESGTHYLLTLYNRNAQRFLLEHIEEISHIQK